MKYAFAFVFCLFVTTTVAKPRFRVVSWNVENLFDARHDSLKQDEEFLPESERAWTWARYWRKVEDVSRVVMGIGEDMPPALVALQEVENDSVMLALTRRGALRAIGYEYVMTDSPDRRGVDVALMYQPLLFRLLGHESWRVPSEAYGLRPTRDLLHVWGRVLGGDTLHVVVCHLPSRAGGTREGRRNRMMASGLLRAKVDSLLSENPRCRLLVMGDFNAAANDKAVRPLLKSEMGEEKLKLKGLLHLMERPQKRPTCGTYRFQGNWSWLDHIMVSDTLFPCASAVQLYTQPWMQRPVSDGTWYPRRTYLGTIYNGGVSDHVPIYCDFDF